MKSASRATTLVGTLPRLRTIDRIAGVELPVLIALAILVLAVSVDRFGVRFGSLNLRVELLIGGLLALWCLVRSRGRALRGVGPIEWCLVGWLVTGGVSSVLFSPAPAESLRLTVLLAGFMTIYAAGFMLLRSPQAIKWAALLWVSIGSLVCFLALVAALLYMFFGSTWGLWLEGNYANGFLTVTPKVHSTLWEPNILGSYSLTVLVLAFALSCAPEFQATAWQRPLRLAMGCACCGLVLSMTRTAWVVGIFLILVLVIATLRMKLLDLRQLSSKLIVPLAIGLPLGLAVGLMMPAVSWRTDDPKSFNANQIEQIVRKAISERGGIIPYISLEDVSIGQDNNPAPLDESSVNTRSSVLDRSQGFFSLDQVSSFVGRGRIYAMALNGWLERPWLGWGTGSYLYVYGVEGGSWVGNLELHVLFDTGIVGLILLAVAAWLAVRRGIRALKYPPARWNTTQFILFGVLVGCVGLFLAYQTTEGTWLGLTWVFFAMLVAAGRYAHANADAQRVKENTPPLHDDSGWARDDRLGVDAKH